MRHRFLSIILSLAAALASAGVVVAQPAGRERGLAFWTGLANDCQIPPGETAFGLVSEAASLLGSRESVWRDDVGYGVVASCVYGKRALSAAERRTLVGQLVRNLGTGAGEAGTDAVLLRSFSALDLSVLAALEAQDPVLDAADYRRLLAAALAYLREEHDLRGLDAQVGWIHALAHTADLLKFLARDARFTPADQEALLTATADRMLSPATPVLTHAEDERLASAIVSVLRRGDLDRAAYSRWLERFVTLEKRVWTQTPPDLAIRNGAQNGRNLLRSLYVLLSLPPRPGEPADAPGPAEAEARQELLQALAAIRR